ncbi:MAG: V-type ATPase 116kDa subunit family protein [Candidatus Dormibacteria bacterium]
MPSVSGAGAVRMCRAALLIPDDRVREGLVEVARAGCVDFDEAPSAPESEVSAALRRLTAASVDGRSALARAPIDPAEMERAGRRDLLAGEQQLDRLAADAVRHAGIAAWIGWMPASAVGELSRRLEALGGAVVQLARPPWLEPPTQLAESLGRTRFHLLVDSFGVVPYADVDPTLFAAATYVLMFGMMFADAGHGAIVALLGLAAGLQRRWPSLRTAWVLISACGVSASVFGLVFGECFGPTGVVQPLWIRPLDNPELLLVVAVLFGSVLMTGSYAMGTINRYREGGWGRSLVAASGVAGFAIFASVGVLAAALLAHQIVLLAAGAVMGVLGLVLLTLGLRQEASSSGAAAAEIFVGIFDTVIRVGTNLVSFARLAAFGLVHAAIEGLVWSATSSLAGRGWLTIVSIVVFAAGNAVAFGLEGLVVAIQALRLEYYELFSRVFVGEGRRFHPWRLDIVEA